MKTILVLGGSGNTGSRIAKLINDHSFSKVIVAGRNKSKLEKVGLEYIILDTQFDITEHLEDIDILVVASTSFDHSQRLNIINSAIKANCDYIDITTSFQDKLEYLKSINYSKLLVTDAGAWPGIPLALIKYAASLDRFTKVNFSGLFSGPGWEAEVTEETLLECEQVIAEFSSKPSVYKNHQWINADKAESIYTNFQQGRFLCRPTFLEEMLLVPRIFPEIECGLYSCSFPENLKERITVFKLETENITITLEHVDGWWISAAGAACVVLQQIKNQQSGFYLAGDFIDSQFMIDFFIKVGISVNISRRIYE
jgi:hypothetical protein